MAAAIALAEADARDHASDLSTPPAPASEYIGIAQSHLLVDPPVHGGEVFSLIRVSVLAPREYLDDHVDTGREQQTHVDDDGTGRARR